MRRSSGSVGWEHRRSLSWGLRSAVLILATCGGCGTPTTNVQFSGDRDAAGALIGVDGKAIGFLPRQPQEWAADSLVGDSTQFLYVMDSRLPLGRHEVECILVSGDTLRGSFKAHESADVVVSTVQRRIWGS